MQIREFFFFFVSPHRRLIEHECNSNCLNVTICLCISLRYREGEQRATRRGREKREKGRVGKQGRKIACVERTRRGFSPPFRMRIIFHDYGSGGGGFPARKEKGKARGSLSSDFYLGGYPYSRFEKLRVRCTRYKMFRRASSAKVAPKAFSSYSSIHFDVPLITSDRNSNHALPCSFSAFPPVRRDCEIYGVASRSNGVGINYSNLRAIYCHAACYVSATLTPVEVSACLQYRA